MLNHKGTMAIETERLILRRFSIDDAEDMFSNWASDVDVTKFLSWEPHDSVKISEQVISDWIKSYDSICTYNWCIVMKTSERVIGHISVIQLNDMHEWCEIGYCLGKAYWSKGVMTEALRNVINFLFWEVGINRIQAKYDTDNPASGKVMEKVGMLYEGTLRKFRKRKDGTYGNSNVYSLLKDECKP